MSAALAAAGLATPVAARMMAVGERSGDMGEMFTEIARFHDDEVARFIDWFTRAFEPMLMAVLGVVGRPGGGADVHADLRAGREHQ